jgi:hypothetical protein
MPEHFADEPHHVVQLRDGRWLSYAQYGDPDGFAILNAHGGLACRLDVATAAPAAELCRVPAHLPRRSGGSPAFCPHSRSSHTAVASRAEVTRPS